MAWSVIRRTVPAEVLEVTREAVDAVGFSWACTVAAEFQGISVSAKVSFLRCARQMSTSCTGCGTAEVAAALVEQTVNESGLVAWRVRLTPTSCHAPRLESNATRGFVCTVFEFRSK